MTQAADFEELLEGCLVQIRQLAPFLTVCAVVVWESFGPQRVG
jgi:hypothetical protein